MIEAARRAHFAFDDALAERLLRTIDDESAGTAAGILLGEVLGELGRHDEAEAALARAGEQAKTDDERALAVIQRAEELFWGLDRGQDAVSLLTSTAAELGGTEWAEEMLGQRATFDLLDGRPQVALEAIQDQLDGTGHGRPFVEAAIVAGAALAICGRCRAGDPGGRPRVRRTHRARRSPGCIPPRDPHRQPRSRTDRGRQAARSRGHRPARLRPVPRSALAHRPGLVRAHARSSRALRRPHRDGGALVP